jgi:hypothetical protein
MLAIDQALEQEPETQGQHDKRQSGGDRAENPADATHESIAQARPQPVRRPGGGTGDLQAPPRE